jgi:hypothetical protein
LLAGKDREEGLLALIPEMQQFLRREFKLQLMQLPSNVTTSFLPHVQLYCFALALPNVYGLARTDVSEMVLWVREHLLLVLVYYIPFG